jgi:predicted nucleic acid-binding protein
MILDMVEEGRLKPVYCKNIMDEYIEVLNRPRFGFPAELVNGMLDLFDLHGIVTESEKSAFHMADESDRVFYDTAIAASASLITGNGKHYPAGPPIISPAEFVASILN